MAISKKKGAKSGPSAGNSKATPKDTGLDPVEFAQTKATLLETLDRCQTQKSLIDSQALRIKKMEEEHKSMADYLRSEVATRDEQITAARSEIERLTSAVKGIKAETSKEWTHKHGTLTRRHEDLKEKYEKACVEIESLAKFQETRAEYEREIADLKVTVGRHAEEMEELNMSTERAVFRTKEALRQDMERALAKTRQEMLALTETHLEAATEDTIRENARMGAELAYQSRATVKILESNNKLVNELNDARRKLDVARQNETLLGKRLTMQKSLIKKVSARIDSISPTSTQDDVEELQTELTNAKMRHKTDAETIAALNEAHAAMRAQIGDLEGEVARLQTDRAAVTGQMSASAEFLFDALAACSQMQEDAGTRGSGGRATPTLEADVALLKYFLGELRKYPPATQFVPRVAETPPSRQSRGMQTLRPLGPMELMSHTNDGKYGSRLHSNS